MIQRDSSLLSVVDTCFYGWVWDVNMAQWGYNGVVGVATH